MIKMLNANTIGAVLIALSLSACGWSFTGGKTVPVEVFDPAATGCTVTAGDLTASESGGGEYFFNSLLEVGTAVTATGCIDSVTGAQLPQMYGVMQTGGIVISPITTLIVAAVSDAAPGEIISAIDLQNAIKNIASNLGLGNYDPVNPVTANYVETARADATGTSVETAAMRVGLAISTLLKLVEVAVDVTESGDSVSELADAILEDPIDLADPIEVVDLLITVASTLDPINAAAVTSMATGIASVVATISNSTGTTETAIAATSAVVTVLNDASAETMFAAIREINYPPRARAVSIADTNGGVVEVGDTLTGSYAWEDPESDQEGTSTYQWLSGGVAISGATSKTYIVASVDLGSEIRFQVIPRSSNGGVGGKALSSGILVGAVIPNQVPYASSVSIIDDNGGSVVVGDSLSGSYTYADVDGDAEGTSTFRWLGAGSAITGATSLTYTLVADDTGKGIAFEITPVASSGTTNGTAVTSSAVMAGVGANAGNDRTVLTSQKLTLNGTASTSAGTILTYIWKQISGTVAVLDTPNSATTTLTTSGQEEDLIFELTVTDDSGFSDTDLVTVTLIAPHALSAFVSDFIEVCAPVDC